MHNPSTRAFDYIVVGGGSAGCVIANRLSADPSVRVALIEAGPSDRSFPANVKTSLPAGNLFLLPHAKYNWMFKFAPHAGVNGRELPCPRGKVLGGCSSINGSMYLRGHPGDYDDWAALGNEGWAWKDVLPMFKAHEDHEGGDPAYHGRGGELKVSVPRHNLNPMSEAFVAAAVASGHAFNEDPNGARQEGFGFTHATQSNGVRYSASRAFIHPIWDRPNLAIFTETMVERVRMRAGRAVGVTIVREGRREELDAGTEVILSGGAIASPQLLMLSGIGPAAHLREHGIEVVQDLAGVGRNLQDHPTQQVSALDPSATSYALTARGLPNVLTAPFSYLLNRRGMLASNAAEATGYIHTVPGLERADIQMTFVVGLKAAVQKLPRQHGLMLMVHLMRPLSRGEVRLRSADPLAAPEIQPNFMSHQADVDTLRRGVREARRILAAEPFKKHYGTEYTPGPQYQTDAELDEAIRSQVGTAYHPVGTCKMGSDDQAVVDAQLRVHGVEGLRVVDASIMPKIIGGNTNAPTMMIAEQAARFIKEGGARRPAAERRPLERAVELAA
jgi:choline dehydrogenase